MRFKVHCLNILVFYPLTNLGRYSADTLPFNNMGISWTTSDIYAYGSLLFNPDDCVQERLIIGPEHPI